MRTPFPLGRRVEHDPRSLAYPAPAASVTSKSWTHYGPILDQGQVGSCTGNAMAGALNTRPLHTLRAPLLTEDDALRLYSEATELDNAPGSYPPDDTGSSGLAVAKAAQKEGRIGSYQHAFGLDHALQSLMSGPVLIGSNWYEGMFHPSSAGLVTISGSVAGGHEYLAVGVSVPRRTVTCVNSWGASWGRRGRFTLTWDTLDRLLSEQGDVTVPVR